MLLLSAMFSGSETALFSFPREEFRRGRRRSSASARAIVSLLGRPRRLLVTVLLGNTVVNVAYFATAWRITREVAAHNAGLSVLMGAGSLVALVLCGEILPKAAAVRFPTQVAKATALPLVLFARVTAPVRIVLSYIVELASAVFGKSHDDAEITTEELQELAELSEKRGFLEIGEGKMIAGAMQLREITVSEVMVPRVDMVACDVNRTTAEFVKLADRKRLTKLPVFEGSLDNIIGIVYVKEAVLSPASALRDLVRPVYFVPEVANLDALLKQFRERRIQFAVAVDEFGGTAGIVALEDVLEVIVGEISDEFDDVGATLQMVGPGRYIASGRLTSRELSEALNVEIDFESADTLAGLLADQLGRIPVSGDVVEYGGLRFRVNKVAKRRVVEVEVVEKVERR